MVEVGKLLIGIDDAGRGPVIGPMVLAGALMTQESEKELAEAGVTDSKLLTKKKREALIPLIKEKSIAVKTHIITPSEIDTGMGEGLNLNQVEALAAGVIINNLIKNVKDKNKTQIIIDCPSVNCEAWKKTLIAYLDDPKLNIDCKHKADLKHPVVSAASIVAKVTRDSEIEKLKEKIGADFGSGYPADPKTKEFLAANYNKYKKERIFRETWSTFQKAKNKKSQMKLPDY